LKYAVAATSTRITTRIIRYFLIDASPICPAPSGAHPQWET
jgi:hypothetical protein